MSADRRGTHAVKLAFEPDTIDLAIEQLVPLKVLRPGAKESKKYAQIRGSIKAIGLVEAPVVARNLDDPAKFFLLDGHMRIEALKDLGIQRVECLVSTDDETYTYNKRINRLAAVQEHSMIKRAIARGVPEAAIAEALGLNIETIFRRTRLLNGICPEAVEVLKDTSAPMAVFDILRRMGPIRQVEAAELMAGQNNYSVQFAKALLAATPDAALAVPRRKPPKREGQVSTEQMAKMERELASLQTQVKSFEETYGVDTLHLTVARGYIRKLLGNPKVVSWLGQHRGEYLGEFRSLTDSDGEGTDRTIG